MTKKQEYLKSVHGTPEDFEKAIWTAHGYLVITENESRRAIEKYKDEWEAAGRKPTKAEQAKLNKANYKKLYENLSKRISRLHAYADRTGNRVLKNIAWGQPDYYGS